MHLSNLGHVQQFEIKTQRTEIELLTHNNDDMLHTIATYKNKHMHIIIHTSQVGTRMNAHTLAGYCLRYVKIAFRFRQLSIHEQSQLAK